MDRPSNASNLSINSQQHLSTIIPSIEDHPNNILAQGPFHTLQCTFSLDKMTTPAAPSCAASVCETCMSSDWLPVSMWCISCTGMDFKNRSCKGNLQSVASDKRARLFLLRQQDEEKVGLKRTPGRQKRNTPIFLAQMSLLFPLLPSRRARRFVA